MDAEYAQCGHCGELQEADGLETLGDNFAICGHCNIAGSDDEWVFGDAEDFADVLDGLDDVDDESPEDQQRRILAAQLELAHGKLEELTETAPDDAKRLRDAINAEAWHEIAEFVGEAEAMEKAGAWRD